MKLDQRQVAKLQEILNQLGGQMAFLTRKVDEVVEGQNILLERLCDDSPNEPRLHGAEQVGQGAEPEGPDAEPSAQAPETGGVLQAQEVTHG